eukprot:TRINITY_DN5113_c1_g4_i1.p1 TRINITY_DN5113_c1_g4~~TRINITY_DN5113_c1_g4_i1.p1  ORF type:complete len:177 (+),score=40.09 TRINITY_DN5113_c1_g4_i1:73-603(+)
MSRTKPNVLVTGTPGVGKTTFCEAVAAAVGFKHIEVSKMVKEKKLYREWDDEMNCSIFDDELVGDALEPVLGEESTGGYLVDFHSSGFLDDQWFDLAICLRASTETLYDRLEKRHYPEHKVKENVEAEIFQTCLEEARELFEESSVEIWELENNNQENMEEAIAKLSTYINSFEPK